MACIYYLRLPGQEELRFDTKEALTEHIRKNNLESSLKAAKREYGRTTEDLAAVLRQAKFGEHNFTPEVLKEFQYSLLDDFIRLEEQADFFFKMGSAVALTKGLGKNFDNIDNINKKLGELGIGKPLDDKAPFDVRYLLTGDPQYKTENSSPYYHQLTANNIKIAKEIDALSSTMFMERTSSFKHTTEKVVANLKNGIISDKVGELQDELAAFAQIAAYKQWIKVNDKETSTLRNSLIYDSLGNTPTIVDIVRDLIDKAPDNTFLKFILPVSTIVKIGKRKKQKNLGRELINTIEGKTRGRLEPDLIAGMMDSFTELYQNPKTQYHAKALFDYLIVKDGLMFKNKSFIKLLPTVMFKEMSEATEIATKLMAANSDGEFKTLLKELNNTEIFDKEGNPVDYFTEAEKVALRESLKAKDIAKTRDLMFQKVFKLDYNSFYDRFESIYATDIRNQYNLELMRLAAGGKKLEPIVKKTEDKVDYIHVQLFNDKFKAMEKGSDARKKYFGEIIEQLGTGGFGIKTEKGGEDEPNKHSIIFKKYMRLRQVSQADEFGDEKTVTYITYKLKSVTRDGKIYSGLSMTQAGELTPTGEYAVYEPITPVGASNTTGVADLGARPNKDQILDTINKKKKDGDEGQAGMGVTPTTNPTPGLGGGVLGNPEAGTSFTLPNQEPISGGEGLQDQISKPSAPTSIAGDLFGQLGQAPYDPNTDGPMPNFTDDDIDNNEC